MSFQSMLRTTALLLLPLMIAACDTPVGEKEIFRYQCSKYTVDVDYELRKATLYDAMHQVTLFNIPSTAGIKYESSTSDKDAGDKVTFLGKGAGATLLVGQESYPCQLRSASD